MTARAIAILCMGGATLLTLVLDVVVGATARQAAAAVPGLCGVVVVARAKPAPKPRPTLTPSLPTSKPIPTQTPTPLVVVVSVPTSPPLSTRVPGPARADDSHLAGKYGPRPGIVCVWTGISPRSRPVDTYVHGRPVYLIAAWRVMPRADLPRDSLQLRWSLYHPYHRRLRFIPPRGDLVAYRRLSVPGRLRVGTYRLRMAPVVRHLQRGWYEVLARAVLYGPHCPRGCVGQSRQTRFFMY